MALKSTSSPIVISTAFTQGTNNAFNVQQVDLQLNPLDQEVFVVTAVAIDFTGMPFPETELSGQTLQSKYEVSVCKSRPPSFQGLESSNCIAIERLITLNSFLTGTNKNVAIYNSTPLDTPPSQLDYLDIIATDSFFIAMDGSNTLGPSSGAVRIFGYRARADSATYAALVQSEMLSA